MLMACCDKVSNHSFHNLCVSNNRHSISTKMVTEASNQGRALRDIAIVVVFLAVNIGIPRYLKISRPPVTKRVRHTRRHRRNQHAAPAAAVTTLGSVSIAGHGPTAVNVPEAERIETIDFLPTTAIAPAVDCAPIVGTARQNEATRPRKLESFVRLPVEIREMIYEYAMRNDGVFDLPIHVTPRDKSAHLLGLNRRVPAVCFTSKTEQTIATGVLIRHSTFRLSHEPHAGFLSYWLKHIDDGSGFRSVRRVEIGYDPVLHSRNFARDFELLRRCPGLRDLDFVIPLEELNFVTYNAARRPMSKRPLAATELIAKFQFSGVLKCSSLRNITCSISSKYGFEFASRLPLYLEITKVIESVIRSFKNRYGRAFEAAIDLSNDDGKVLDRLWEVRPLERGYDSGRS
jgi:hypothetical protein